MPNSSPLVLRIANEHRRNAPVLCIAGACQHPLQQSPLLGGKCDELSLERLQRFGGKLSVALRVVLLRLASPDCITQCFSEFVVKLDSAVVQALSTRWCFSVFEHP